MDTIVIEDGERLDSPHRRSRTLKGMTPSLTLGARTGPSQGLVNLQWGAVLRF